MSKRSSKNDWRKDALALSLAGGGGFLVLLAVLTLKGGGLPQGDNLLAVMARASIGSFGLTPSLVAGIATAAVGVWIYLTGHQQGVLKHLAGALFTTLGLSVLLGALSATAGGNFGAATGGSATNLLTKGGGILFGLLALATPLYLFWFRGRIDLSFLRAAAPRPAADTDDEDSGVSVAEAEALAPAIAAVLEEPTAPVPVDVPDLYPEDVRLKGQLPVGTQAIGSDGLAPEADHEPVAAPREVEVPESAASQNRWTPERHEPEEAAVVDVPETTPVVAEVTSLEPAPVDEGDELGDPEPLESAGDAKDPFAEHTFAATELEVADEVEAPDDSTGGAQELTAAAYEPPRPRWEDPVEDKVTEEVPAEVSEALEDDEVEEELEETQAADDSEEEEYEDEESEEEELEETYAADDSEDDSEEDSEEEEYEEDEAEEELEETHAEDDSDDDSEEEEYEDEEAEEEELEETYAEGESDDDSEEEEYEEDEAEEELEETHAEDDADDDSEEEDSEEAEEDEEELEEVYAEDDSEEEEYEDEEAEDEEAEDEEAEDEEAEEEELEETYAEGDADDDSEEEEYEEDEVEEELEETHAEDDSGDDSEDDSEEEESEEEGEEELEEVHAADGSQEAELDETEAEEAPELVAAEDASAVQMDLFDDPQPAVAEESEPEVVLEPQAAATPDDARKISAEMLAEAGNLFLKEKRVAVSMLQKRYSLDFEQSCVVLDELQQLGLIGPYAGGSQRDILLSSAEWLELTGQS